MEVQLFRLKRGDQGTMGILMAPGFSCYTLELPWRDNQRNISCIPEGEYDVRIRISPKYGQVYHVKKVPNRSYILIHSGNWAGDTSKGYRTHVNGCILLGKSRGTLAGQLAVLNSRITVKKFMKIMDNRPFTLKIHDGF
jgi:hypothetical protein